MLPRSGEISRLLVELRAGDAAAGDRLMTLLYDQLRKLAHGQRMRRRAGGTMNTTALVHEAYLKLLGRGPRSWRDRGHFFAVAATAMRHILVDYAERAGAQKRGGDLRRTTLDGSLAAPAERAAEMAALGEALDRLSEVDPQLTTLVELRFFAGLTRAETARALGVSESTVGREWLKARVLLHRLLVPGPSDTAAGSGVRGELREGA